MARSALRPHNMNDNILYHALARPRANPGDRLQYKRVNGPYTLIMTATGEYKLPFGPLPRLLMAWLSTEAIAPWNGVLNVQAV